MDKYIYFYLLLCLLRQLLTRSEWNESKTNKGNGTPALFSLTVWMDADESWSYACLSLTLPYLHSLQVLSISPSLLMRSKSASPYEKAPNSRATIPFNGWANRGWVHYDCAITGLNRMHCLVLPVFFTNCLLHAVSKRLRQNVLPRNYARDIKLTSSLSLSLNPCPWKETRLYTHSLVLPAVQHTPLHFGPLLAHHPTPILHTTAHIQLADNLCIRRTHIYGGVFLARSSCGSGIELLHSSSDRIAITVQFRLLTCSPCRS